MESRPIDQAEQFYKAPAELKKEKKTAADADSAKISNINDLFSQGNAVTPLVDGNAIFSTAADMIKSAKSNLQVEMYSFSSMEMAQLLADDAKRGVKVQVILDPSPGKNAEHTEQKKKVVDYLKKNGVDVVMYPVDAAKKQIDHVKLMIVDGKSILIGGMNWNDHSKVNHDVDFKVDGPAANYFEKVFADDWEKSGGKEFTPPPPAVELPEGEAFVSGAITGPGEQGIRKLVLGKINSAKKSIHAELFVLSDKETVDALIAAHKRGVDVRVILDPNGVKNGFTVNVETAKVLKKAGVPVRWYKVDTSVQQMMHGKWAAFDDEEAVVGSSNWTFNGFNINHEANVNVKSQKAVSVLENTFEHDWNNMTQEELPDIPAEGTGDQAG